ncbi:hypothetical protein [Streptomyces sp. SAI-090]|uniref:hypothetical protein n=1 Tax=Streptomyces sp. SAI-090 TaxID=2940545 RepID=UPI0024735181|nr:hypothetical protein [Streptomyces sp. SAI-090]
MTTPHDDEDGGRDTAVDGTPDPAHDNGVGTAAHPARRRPGLRPTVAAAVVVALTAAVVLALRDGSGGGGRSAATTEPSPSASAVTPPAAQVRPVHEALHDIDAVCRAEGGGGGEQASLTRDVDTIIDFSRRYPDARFPIDDETGSTLSLLLVTRQSMRECAPDLGARVDRALPSDFRDRALTAS